MPPTNAWRNSIPGEPLPSPSSSTPILAAWRREKACIDAYRKALACDPVSAFGGVIALNRPLDAETARAIVEIFTEVIIAPDASAEAIEIVGGKKNLRLLLAGGLPDPRAKGLVFKSVAGGLLVQSRDDAVADDLALKTVTKRKPTAAELSDLKFAFRVAKHVKSNTIVYAKDGATVGIGAGQMSRVDAARIAARKAEDAAKAAKLKEPMTKGSVVASDAFFPFADGSARRHRSRRHRGHSAGRFDPRRRGDRRRRQGRDRDGLHRRAPLPPLSMIPKSGNRFSEKIMLQQNARDALIQT